MAVARLTISRIRNPLIPQNRLKLFLDLEDSEYNDTLPPHKHNALYSASCFLCKACLSGSVL
jgi:hypothetical protein